MDINDITYKIRAAVFEVNKVLGAGFLEKVYENALLFELRLRGLNVENQVPIKVSYKGETVGEYFAGGSLMTSFLTAKPAVRNVCVSLCGSVAN